MSEEYKSPQEIKAIEERLAKLENFLAKQSLMEEATSLEETPETTSAEEDDFEMRISQYWLPKLGITAFVIGMLIFLIQPLEYLPVYLPVLSGYGIALIVAALSQYFKRNFPEFFGYIIGGSAAIAYLTTLRLYFFGNSLITNISLEIFLLLLVCSSIIIFSLRNHSIYLSILGLFFGFVTLNFITEPFLQLAMVALFSGIITYISKIYNWKTLILFGVVFSYLSFLNCMFGNVLMGNSLGLLPEKHFYFLFIILYSAIYSLGLLFSRDLESDDFLDVFTVFILSAGGYGIFLIMTLLNNAALGLLHFVSAVVSMSLAIAFWTKVKSQYSTFIFAMIAYSALSVTFISNYDKPDYFIFLGWQSLLVISTALWFKSRFIIVANVIIFLMVLAGYLFTGIINFAGISFGIIALVSPRLLNWKQERLELETEKIRNVYLLTALLWNPYFIYSTISGEFVGLALLALALFYFGMSKMLKNLKYRLMAVLTLLITVFYLMFLGLTDKNITYKVLSFLLAGVILLITSAAYSRMKTKMKKI